MFTSLNKDLHSVYIDGEMPENFISQYESIIEKNSTEKSRLEKMQVLHSLFQEDSAAKTVSDDFVNASFERLQTKLHYAKNTSLAQESKTFIKPFVKYASSFAAAAAVFALIFIPVHTNSLKNAKETAVATIKIMKQNGIKPIAQKDVVVDGNINKEDLPKVLSKNSVAKVQNSTKNASKAADFIEESLPVQHEQKTISATNLASNQNVGGVIARQLREQLTSVDPFLPDFSSSPIQITISIPNFRNLDYNQHQNEIMSQHE